MAKNLVARNTAQDLRTAYLLAFDNFSTEPVEVGNAVNGNSRYGRELLATLVHGGILCTTLVNNAEQVWQCLETYDSVDRAAAEATIDAFLATFEDEAPAPKPKAPTSLLACKCGCGELANKDRDYRPGHDARHAGNIGRAMAAEFALGHADKAEALVLQLPSAALRAKARGVALKAAEGKTRRPKAAPKAARTKVAKDVRVLGTVKAGRWTYPAMMDAKGGVVRNTKRDGSGDWKAAPVAKFIAS